MVWKASGSNSVAITIASEEFTFQQTNAGHRVEERRPAQTSSSLYVTNQSTSLRSTDDEMKTLSYHRVNTTPMKKSFVRRNAMKTRVTSLRKRMMKTNQLFDIFVANKLGLSAFRSFLESEFSKENFDFWIACEKYKTLKKPCLVKEAQEIVNQFLLPTSPNQVNISWLTRKFVLIKAEGGRRDAFQRAQERIYQLMSEDSFPRFCSKYPSLVSHVIELHKITKKKPEKSFNNNLEKPMCFSPIACKVTLRRTSCIVRKQAP
ncbi:regulator of G-protein signaling 2-like [Clavelina lepadiformis]|uniref:regulator of G-protein signaling 2-like n=1 Tax=Clavelina lepadiformis TaxID=159417 RepID=UPI0040423A0E